MNTYRTITYGNWVTQTDSFESVYDPVDTIITMPATPSNTTKSTEKNGQKEIIIKDFIKYSLNYWPYDTNSLGYYLNYTWENYLIHSPVCKNRYLNDKENLSVHSQ